MGVSHSSRANLVKSAPHRANTSSLKTTQRLPTTSTSITNSPHTPMNDRLFHQNSLNTRRKAPRTQRNLPRPQKQNQGSLGTSIEVRSKSMSNVELAQRSQPEKFKLVQKAYGYSNLSAREDINQVIYEYNAPVKSPTATRKAVAHHPNKPSFHEHKHLVQKEYDLGRSSIPTDSAVPISKAPRSKQGEYFNKYQKINPKRHNQNEFGSIYR